MCAFILEGVHRGMGRHNAAIESDDDKVAALMVRIEANFIPSRTELT